METNTSDRKYLQSLSKFYPNRQAVATEIINLSAILNLPKGTEHYVTDIHGEYEQFTHIMRNGSGAVRRKINEEFGNTILESDKRQLATLIYYPKEKMELLLKDIDERDNWYGVILRRLVRVAKRASSKYTRSKVRKALPPQFSYVMEELMNDRAELSDHEAYYQEIFAAVIKTGRAEELIIEFCKLIRRLTVDHIHIVGDIFDRGPLPHKIMDDLMNAHSIDFEWGNHDILWMGAACGQLSCIATVIRICARYGHLEILEDGYGINIVPLVRFALANYGDDPCSCFGIHGMTDEYDKNDEELDIKIHKAISIIQFKLEGQLIKMHPEYHMDDRLLLDKMDLEEGTVVVDGKKYKLLDTRFPTVDPEDPYALTEEEYAIMMRMQQAFVHSEKLHRHVRFLYNKGSLYKIYNRQLIFHGCVPFNPDGTFMSVELGGKVLSGKALYDELESQLRFAYYDRDEKSATKSDVHWFCWSNQASPLFGKNKMATFERYFIEEKETHKEISNTYYRLIEDEEAVNKIFTEFGLSGQGSHIINGHVPVRAIEGESPLKCGGKVLTIDGGFSRAYQPKTGIAGYTLVNNSYGILLVAHDPFESRESAIVKETDVHSHEIEVEMVVGRKLVKDTDIGEKISQDIEDLTVLLEAYRKGMIPETGK
ncbi:MAG: fructose-1,6-bisphosphatase [Lachnospiraceae bacterium]|jgi:fructose-1,6-bisphosphatase-3